MSEKIKFLFWGMLSAIGALVFESFALIFSDIFSSFNSTASQNCLLPLGVLIEELFSIIIIWKLFQILKNKKGLFYAALFFGAGFSIPEIAFYISNHQIFSQEILLSYFGLFLIHTATAGIFGCYFTKKQQLSPDIFLFFILAFLTHLAFNLAIFFNFSNWIIFIIPIFILFACFLASKKQP